MTGQTLGHYRVLEKLGEGGMGVVYRAEDTKLRRQVALKVLPAHLAEHRERFLREAQAAASLTHKNICTVYEIDEAEGFIVMELIEGKTLRDIIAERPLPLNEALDIAMQCCEGLQHAHERGVVHRDIKPGNIMRTANGDARIMDFGLAQVGDRTRITKTGVSTGTPAYMSPEQAKGEAVDRRTDIWSLGATIYEMLAGAPPFKGDIEAAVARAIVSDDPEPLTSRRAGLPIDIDRIVSKALAKPAASRYQHVEDLLVDLRGLRRDGAPVRVQRSWRSYVVAGVAAVALIAAGYLARGSAGSAEAPVPIAISFPIGQAFGNSAFNHSGLAVSPDGLRIVFSMARDGGRRMLGVRSISSATPAALAGTAEGMHPMWSPDGKWLAFFANGKLNKVLADGGTPIELYATTTGIGGTWGPNGMIATSNSNREPLFLVPSSGGGASVRFSKLDERLLENSHRYPQFLPGDRVLYTARATRENSAIYVQEKDGSRKLIQKGQMRGSIVTLAGKGRSYLLTVNAGTLFAQRIDPESLALSGDPVALFEGVFSSVASAYGAFAASANGLTLAFVKGQLPSQQMTWFSPAGERLGTLGNPNDIFGPRISPDGRQVVFGQPDPQSGNRDLWLGDVQSGSVERLTLDAGNDWQPSWSRDGKTILFASDREGGVLKMFGRSPGAGSADQQLSPLRADPIDWHPNGKVVAYSLPNKGNYELSLLPLEGEKKPVALLRNAATTGDLRFSPDGRWVAYVSSKSGRPEVYVRDFNVSTLQLGETEYRVSAASGVWPRWRADGGELYFVATNRDVMAARITAGKPSAPVKLFAACLESIPAQNWSSDFDVSPDGKRFLFACPVPQPPMEIHAIVNWSSLLKDTQ